MKLQKFLYFCMALGILLHTNQPSAILFGDYPYPEES